MTMLTRGDKEQSDKMDEDRQLEAEIDLELSRLDVGNEVSDKDGSDEKLDEDLHLDLENNTDDSEMTDLESDGESQVWYNEMRAKMKRMVTQTSRMEEELKGIDELLDYKSPRNGGQAVMVYDDFKDLEEAARKEGLDPEQMRRKILADMEKESEGDSDEEADFEDENLKADEVEDFMGGFTLDINSELEAIKSRNRAMDQDDSDTTLSTDQGEHGAFLTAAEISKLMDPEVQSSRAERKAAILKGSLAVSNSIDDSIPDIPDETSASVTDVTAVKKTHTKSAAHVVGELLQPEADKAALQQSSFEINSVNSSATDITEGYALPTDGQTVLGNNLKLVTTKGSPDEVENMEDLVSGQPESAVETFKASEPELMDNGGERDTISIEHEENSTNSNSNKREVAVDSSQNASAKAGVVAPLNMRVNFLHYLRDQMKIVEEKYKQREIKWREEYQEAKKMETERETIEEEKRQIVLQKLKEEGEKIKEEQQKETEKLNEEIRMHEALMQEEQVRFERDIAQLSEQTQLQKEQLQRTIQEEQARQEEKKSKAAVKIQSYFRGYKVRKSTHSIMEEKREEIHRQMEEKKLQAAEEIIHERQEEERKRKEEEQRKEDEARRKKEEEERKIQEQKRKEEEEKKRIEEEIRKKEEEEKRKKEEEERKIKEEERRKEEERKKKEEEERQRQEEEKRKKEEEERKKKEEEERKRAEEERKRREEEERIRLEEERKKEEALRLQREEEERRQKEEAERKKIEEEQKREEELRKQKEEEERKRLEEEQQKKAAEEAKATTNSVESSAVQQNPVGLVANVLPQHLEARRLAWIKECLPWSKLSNEPWKLKAGVSKRPPRRPSSAKKLPLLEESVIMAAAQTASLRQVTTVSLSDLPGCNMAPLGQCWGLRCLKMSRCGLVAVEGLNQCSQLLYLSLTDNAIEYVDLKDCGSLQVLDLSHNRVAVLHGLGGCTNLRWLDLSHNRLTRLGEGLSGLRRLHTLRLCHNQLISSEGLGEVPTLQHLDLTHNHLQSLDHTSKLALLQHLDCSHNNLLQVPELNNQVLLLHLLLGDNSLSSLEGLSACWLPLLHTLSLQTNSLVELESLPNSFLLKALDISRNQILDIDTIVTFVQTFALLEELSVIENPATDVGDTSRLKSAVSRLRLLDGADVSSSTPPPPTPPPASSFQALCLTQRHLHHQVAMRFNQELNEQDLGLEAVAKAYSHYCDKSFKMAVDHRYAHEYGDLTMATVPMAPTTPRTGRPRSGRLASKYLSPKEMFEQALEGDKKTPREAPHAGKALAADRVADQYLSPKEMFERALGGSTEAKQSSATEAPAKQPTVPADKVGKLLQAELEAGGDRPQQHSPELPTQEEDEISAAEVLKELNAAATKIQALWRGYQLRAKLLAALEYARLSGFDDENYDDDLGDFNMDDIDFNMDDLEKGWRPSDVPQIPTSHPVIGKPPPGKRLSAGDVPHLPMPPSPLPPLEPRSAWRGGSLTPNETKGYLPLGSSPGPQGAGGADPHHGALPLSSTPSGLDSHRTGASKKEAQITDEWGFKNAETAHLMMLRAKKMKYNSERKQKMKKLDPKQRLALIRKLQENTCIPAVTMPSRRTLPRKEYFQAQHEEMLQQEFEKQEEMQTRVNRTYEWLHTVVTDHPITSSRIHPSNKNRIVHASDGNLSNDQPNTKVQLWRQPHSIELESVSTADSSLSQRRASLGGSPFGHGTVLPPIQPSPGSGSAPKERMSWRNKPTTTDVGWGGGRKRSGKH